MNDSSEFYLQKMLSAIRDAIEQSGVEYSAEDFVELERKLRANYDEVDPDLLAKVAMAQLEVFVASLLTRQGAHPPDFESLYARKAELDRKFLSDDTPQ